MKYKFSQYAVCLKEDTQFCWLYNTVKGSIIKLEAPIYNTLKNRTFRENEIQYFKPLLDMSFIVSVNKKEFNEIIFKEREAEMESVPLLHFVIAPTTACNLRCVYCFENAQNDRYVMSDETVENVVDFIVKKAKQNVGTKKVNVSWFGGEPMLAFEQIVKFSKSLKSKLKALKIKYTSHMVTNGILLTKHRAKVLSTQCNLKSVQITLDGCCDEYCKRKKATPKMYNQLIQNIGDIVDFFDVRLRLNCDKNNLSEMYQLADIIFSAEKNRNKLHMVFAYLRDYTGGDGANSSYFTYDEYLLEANKFYKYLDEKGYEKDLRKVETPYHRALCCPLNHKNNYAIGPHGELYKCEHYFGQKDKVLGNVIDGLFYNNKLKSFINGKLNKKCKTCPMYPICFSNCDEIHGLVKFENGECSRHPHVLKNLINSSIKYIK